jgi:hypothetical protein
MGLAAGLAGATLGLPFRGFGGGATPARFCFGGIDGRVQPTPIRKEPITIRGQRGCQWQPRATGSARQAVRREYPPTALPPLCDGLSTNGASPSAPTCTSLTIQTTRPPLARQQTRKDRSGPRAPKLTAVPIELLRRIRKGQFNLRRLRLNGRGAPAIWNAVLAA